MPVFLFLLPACPQAPVTGRFGGTVTVPVNADPQTFNPIFAVDSTSQLLASLTMADLMHINPSTLAVEPALAERLERRGADHWVLHLRRGLRFSDGEPFTAADVAFSFQVYTDPQLAAPERQLLTVGGRPIRCRVLDDYTVALDLPGTIAVGTRVLDSVWMLPRHRLLAAFRAGKLAGAWGVGTPPAMLAGLGPFRLAAYEPGHDLVLERNPYYWRSDAHGRALPFLDRVRLPLVADPGLRLTLFARGQVDGLASLGSGDFARLAHSCCMLDAGASLNPEVLVLNFGAAPPGHRPPSRDWFGQLAVRRAISDAIDRVNLVRNVYQGRAQPLASLTSPSAGRWADPMPPSNRNLAQARAELAGAGFRLQEGRLVDTSDRPVVFSLILPASNAERHQIAVFLQEDLRQLGMEVQITPLEFNSYLERLMHGGDFEAALVGLQSADADPNEESNEWPLDGAWHFWDAQPRVPRPWERDLDRWFHLQLSTSDPAARLRDYRQIQMIEHRELPLIPLVAPDILVGVRPGLRNVHPALLPPHLLWNAAELYWDSTGK